MCGSSFGDVVENVMKSFLHSINSISFLYVAQSFLLFHSIYLLITPMALTLMNDFLLHFLF